MDPAACENEQKWKPKYHSHPDSISYLMLERRQQVATCVVTVAQYVQSLML